MSGSTAVSATDDDINGVRQTDSMSNLSDMSGNTAILTNRFRMDVACVIDTLQTENLPHRKCAFDELKQVCSLVNANLQQIQARSQIFQIPNHKINHSAQPYHFRFGNYSLKNWILVKQMFWIHFIMPMLPLLI